MYTAYDTMYTHIQMKEIKNLNCHLVLCKSKVLSFWGMVGNLDKHDSSTGGILLLFFPAKPKYHK